MTASQVRPTANPLPFSVCRNSVLPDWNALRAISSFVKLQDCPRNALRAVSSFVKLPDLPRRKRRLARRA